MTDAESPQVVEQTELNVRCPGREYRACLCDRYPIGEGAIRPVRAWVMVIAGVETEKSAAGSEGRTDGGSEETR